jgi:hypothetical protein
MTLKQYPLDLKIQKQILIYLLKINKLIKLLTQKF